jgi:hypothetical protein
MGGKKGIIHLPIAQLAVFYKSDSVEFDRFFLMAFPGKYPYRFLNGIACFLSTIFSDSNHSPDSMYQAPLMFYHEVIRG